MNKVASLVAGAVTAGLALTGIVGATAPTHADATVVALRNGPSSDRTMTVAHGLSGLGPNDYLTPGEYGYFIASMWKPKDCKIQLYVVGLKKYVTWWPAQDQGRWVNPILDVPTSTYRLKC